MNSRRERACQLRQKRLNPVHGIDDIGSGLSLNVEQHSLLVRHSRFGNPSLDEGIFDSILNGGHILQPHRSVVVGVVGENQGGKVSRALDLVVGTDGERLAGSVKAPLRGIGIGRIDHRADGL